ncbi:family 20 glycosylhydrolase [Streptomyces sp. BI20]|uniref:family 20 glycosylhydrolase n=1 Tax=Streptomyces sp. BI20 TaxID=3403460 RepID=UPI003C77F247
MRVPRLLGALLLLVALPVAAAPVPALADAPAVPLSPYDRLLPAPLSAEPGGPGYRIGAGTVVRAPVAPEAPAAAEVRAIAERIAAELGGALGGPPVPVTPEVRAAPAVPRGQEGVVLRLDPADTEVGEEGYRLAVESDRVLLTARTPAGLFHAGRTLNRLREGTEVPGGQVLDRPRFAYRGAMVDIARHYFSPADVRAYVDRIAEFKVNTLHLHLTDDQGWRLDIASWPRLAAYGGGSEVGGGPGGFWTREQYRELVAYAAERYVRIVPEIDMPGHVNAALASYPELNCDDKAPPRYTGIKVGFSSLCVERERTYAFVDDVLREVAELTPGPYLHIGGDEAHATPPAAYAAFMARAQAVVARYGKTVVGWHQLASAEPGSGAVLQWWGHERTSVADRERVAAAVRAGHQVVLSPADRLYLDMKYEKATKPGLAWAGYVPVKRSYDWDPGRYLAAQGVPESSVAGVEAPLWTENVATRAEWDLMAWPRVMVAAELGWAPASAHGWEGFRQRLGAQGPWLRERGIGWFRAPEVPWV